MIQNIILPKQGLQMTEGFITRWLLKEGDTVKEGEPLFEMETDKLVITIDATCSGKLLKILYPEGSTVPITTVIAYVGEDGDALPEGVPQTPAAAIPAAPVIEAAPVVEPAPVAAAAPEVKQPAGPAAAPVFKSTGRIFATPRARTTAEEKGFDLRQIAPTGPDGLIIERDVLGFVPAVQQACGAAPYLLSAQVSVFADDSISTEEVVRIAFAKAAEQSGISCGDASELVVRVIRNSAITACVFPAAAPQITVCENALTLAFYPENAEEDAVLAFFELLCMFVEKPWLAAIR